MPQGSREHLEQRIAEVANELEQMFDDARREQAEQLNQAVRRMRQTADADKLCATAGEAAGRLADGAMVFRVDGGNATSERITVALSEAPALEAAAESKDPVMAAAVAGEVSAALVELLGHEAEARVAIFPVACGEKVKALIYCWGGVQAAAVELVAQAAGAVWSALPAPVPAAPPVPGGQLVTIAVPEAAAKPASAWEELPAEEQQLHLKAQRFARVQAAEMRLYHAEVVQVGRSRRNLYEALRQPIDDARRAFRAQFFTACPSMVDYLHLELTRTLANDDPDLLGSTYPGPLV
jgi:chemotaxis protein histidine kinase CheA